MQRTSIGLIALALCLVPGRARAAETIETSLQGFLQRSIRMLENGQHARFAGECFSRPMLLALLEQNSVRELAETRFGQGYVRFLRNAVDHAHVSRTDAGTVRADVSFREVSGNTSQTRYFRLEWLRGRWEIGDVDQRHAHFVRLYEPPDEPPPGWTQLCEAKREAEQRQEAARRRDLQEPMPATKSADHEEMTREVKAAVERAANSLESGRRDRFFCQSLSRDIVLEQCREHRLRAAARRFRADHFLRIIPHARGGTVSFAANGREATCTRTEDGFKATVRLVRETPGWYVNGVSGGTVAERTGQGGTASETNREPPR